MQLLEQGDQMHEGAMLLDALDQTHDLAMLVTERLVGLLDRRMHKLSPGQTPCAGRSIRRRLRIQNGGQ